MKVLKWIGIGLLILIALVVAIAFLLPSRVHVERSVKIKATPTVVFGLINELNSWHQWSPWHQLDSTTVYVYSETTAGTGAWYTWKSNHPSVGEGKLTITRAEPDSVIETELNFGGMGLSKGTFRIVPDGEELRITWVLDSDGEGVPLLYYIPSKYMNLFMDDKLGQDFEKGLNSIKLVAESVPVEETILGFAVEERTEEETPIIGIRGKVSNTDISRQLGKYFETLAKTLKNQGLSEAGRPMVIWHSYDANAADLEAAVTVSQAATGEGKVQPGMLGSGKAIVVKYYGGYSGMAPVYEALMGYIQSKGLQPAGAPREIYITGPGIEPDTSQWLTEIVMPVN